MQKLLGVLTSDLLHKYQSATCVSRIGQDGYLQYRVPAKHYPTRSTGTRPFGLSRKTLGWPKQIQTGCLLLVPFETGFKYPLPPPCLNLNLHRHTDIHYGDCTMVKCTSPWASSCRVLKNRSWKIVAETFFLLDLWTRLPAKFTCEFVSLWVQYLTAQH